MLVSDVLECGHDAGAFDPHLIPKRGAGMSEALRLVHCSVDDDTCCQDDGTFELGTGVPCEVGEFVSTPIRLGEEIDACDRNDGDECSDEKVLVPLGGVSRCGGSRRVFN